MSRLSYPSRIISVSDCHGGQAPWNPLNSPDIAARLAEGIRSDLPGLQRFDVYGAPLELLQHVVREAVRLQGENLHSDSSGLFVNSAPRTSTVGNGDPFYLAEFDEALRIVTTPLEVLASVRDRVRRLFFLPNENNDLYGPGEQHRSSYTPRLLAENHGLRLEEVSPTQIPELPNRCILTYVDRFGNIVLHENGPLESNSLRQQVAAQSGRTVRLQIGSHSREVQVGSSLSKAAPGSLVAYVNDDSIEVLNKWAPDWTPEQRHARSAWAVFGQEEIGAKVVVT